MNISAFKEFERVYKENKKAELSNSKFIASLLSDNLDITAKLEVVRQILARNNLKAEIERAKDDNKFLVLICGKDYCMSFFQLFSDPDSVVKYLRKKLK